MRSSLALAAVGILGLSACEDYRPAQDVASLPEVGDRICNASNLAYGKETVAAFWLLTDATYTWVGVLAECPEIYMLPDYVGDVPTFRAKVGSDAARKPQEAAFVYYKITAMVSVRPPTPDDAVSAIVFHDITSMSIATPPADIMKTWTPEPYTWP